MQKPQPKGGPGSNQHQAKPPAADHSKTADAAAAGTGGAAAADPLGGTQDFADLPRLATDYTPEQRERVVRFLAGLPEKDLQERAHIHRDQCGRARDQGRQDVSDSEFEHGMMVWDAQDRKAATR
jgi:hypothetical protein